MSKIAVAISVYYKDKATYFEESLDSLFRQSNKNFDVYLQVDGSITKELETVIGKYSVYDNFFCDFSLLNKGLAFQLNRAMEKILSSGKYEYIARMDADDICMPNRFDEQVSFLKRRPDIAVLGSSMIEFDHNGNENNKIMPIEHNELAKNIIKRCPVNHPTVMFNLNSINASDLKYDSSLQNTQDYYLWVDLLKKGYKFANLSQPLLKFRIDENFHERRGFKKAVNDFNSRLYAMKALKQFSASNMLHTILLFSLRISPSYLKKFAYSRLR
ncbi:glycosyltransferase [Pseudoalteromonas sp. S3178]|uniref:glycosyltransferase n=1 Tax=Pseudoalteromonas sp. S3178 TaxID=579532 RepID=UPI001BB14C51|nr:glycosyltransferase [Pseudoalteromonas sp. S3178]